MQHAFPRVRHGDVLHAGRERWLVLSFGGNLYAIPMVGQREALRVGDVRLAPDDIPGMSLRQAMLVRTRDLQPVPRGAMVEWHATDDLLRRVIAALHREIAVERLLPRFAT